jgi:hypothetical protein
MREFDFLLQRRTLYKSQKISFPVYTFFLPGKFSVKGVAEMLAIGLGLDRTTFLEASKTGRVLLNFLKHVTQILIGQRPIPQSSFASAHRDGSP